MTSPMAGSKVWVWALKLLRWGKISVSSRASLDDALDLVVLVGIVNDAALEDREFMAVGGGAFEVSGRSIEMEPLRKKQVDLVDVLLQGRVAGCVVRDVVRGAQSFTGVEGDIGRFAIGLSTRGANGSSGCVPGAPCSAMPCRCASARAAAAPAGAGRGVH